MAREAIRFNDYVSRPPSTPNSSSLFSIQRLQCQSRKVMQKASHDTVLIVRFCHPSFFCSFVLLCNVWPSPSVHQAFGYSASNPGVARGILKLFSSSHS